MGLVKAQSNKPASSVVMLAQNTDQDTLGSVYLLVHDGGQLAGQVPVVGLHLIVVLLLVLLDQALVHRQRLAARVGEMPARVKTKAEF